DVEAVVGYAHERYAKIGLIGFSLGAAVCIIAAARPNPITSLIAVSPPAQFNKIDFHFWKMDVEENIIYNIFKEGRIGKGVRPGSLWLKKIKPIDVVEKIKIPVFFIHGKKDWLFRPWHCERLYQKAQGRKRLELIENGTHAEHLFRRDRGSAVKLFKEWFKLTL
ncbi:MAG: alpha/beta hydrolase, partial [Candidatus Scalindua sp.]